MFTLVLIRFSFWLAVLNKLVTVVFTSNQSD